MKLLHTSDWHLGHELYSYDRREEQEAMLRQMAEIVKDERPDVFVVSGDVYHTAQPSAAVQKMFVDALIDIHKANEEMHIVVTAGNHDSASKHDVFQTPWSVLNVSTVGAVDKERLEEMIVEVPGKAFVIAVPYCNEHRMPAGLFQTLLDMVSERNADGLPVVMMAHTTVSGCSFAGHDNATDDTVGGIDACSVGDMGKGYDYLALGHIHKPQFVHSGHHNVRYCGTPLPVSFDENYAHSVSIVEIGRHGDKPTVREVDIRNPHPLVTLPAAGSAAPWNDVMKMLEDYEENNSPYIRLNVQAQGALPLGAREEARRLCEEKGARFCLINCVKETDVQAGQPTVYSIPDFQKRQPAEIAQSYIEQKGEVFDDELRRLFEEAERLVREEERA